jgi:hypothetical protein
VFWVIHLLHWELPRSMHALIHSHTLYHHKNI